VNTIAVQSDGKILVGGAFTKYKAGAANSSNRIARLNTDGSLDTTLALGAAGTSNGFDNTVNTIAVQSDGKILVGGAFTKYKAGAANSSRRIARLDSNGDLDTTLALGAAGTSNGFNATVNTIAVQSDGKILVGGGFQSYKGGAANSSRNIARLVSNGDLDTTFALGAAGSNNGFNATVNTIAVQSDGKILAGGAFTSYKDGAANSSRNIARLDSDGTFDTSFNLGSGFNYTATEGSDFLRDPDSAGAGRGTSSSYYEGNIKTCADKGMRLPTAYESTVDNSSTWTFPTGDAGVSPTWALTSGVPSYSDETWTASAYDGGVYYVLWSGTYMSGGTPTNGQGRYTRCVLP
jgi:uncharacterized delta-60 repeat protein